MKKRQKKGNGKTCSFINRSHSSTIERCEVYPRVSNTRVVVTATPMYLILFATTTAETRRNTVYTESKNRKTLLLLNPGLDRDILMVIRAFCPVSYYLKYSYSVHFHPTKKYRRVLFCFYLVWLLTLFIAVKVKTI